MDIRKLQKKIIEFRDARDWGQYHNPKDLAISLSLEVAELLEIFQWKDVRKWRVPRAIREVVGGSKRKG